MGKLGKILSYAGAVIAGAGTAIGAMFGIAKHQERKEAEANENTENEVEQTGEEDEG